MSMLFKRGALSIIFLLPLIISGCDSLFNKKSLSANQNLDANSQINNIQDRKVNSHDGKIAELAKKIDGLGGIFINDSGQFSIYLTNPAKQKTTARSVLSKSKPVTSSLTRLRAAKDEYGPSMKNIGVASVSNMKVLKGEYDFNQLKTWNNIASRDILGIPGVYSTDIDESKNRLQIGVKNDEVMAKVEKKLTSLNIPEEAVILSKTTLSVYQRSLRDNFPTKGAGIQIAFGIYNCTMGPNVTWNSGNSIGFITNSHCTNTQGGVESTDYYQPSTNGDFIGEEIRDPEYSSSLYNCPAGRECRRSDAALIEYNTGVSAEKGLIHGPQNRDPNNGTLEVGYKYYSDVVGGYNFEGYPQDKIGRTTGWTYGDLTNICINIKVYEEGPNGQPVDTGITLLCQNEVQAGSGDGDSGSPVFERRGGDVLELVGVMWGGRTNSSGTDYFGYSPIENIKNEVTDIYDPNGIRLDFSSDRCPPSNPYCNAE